MKGDFTRLSFRANKRYTRVHMQQGRVQLDADWNEQVDIQTYQQEAAAAAFIGGSGAPKASQGFLVGVVNGATPDLTLSTGRFYVDGRLSEVFADTPATYTKQPFLPSAPLPAGLTAPQSLNSLGASVPWLVYLDVWSRHVTVLEDAQLREVGLSGPDTTTRTQTVWQVKLVQWPSATAQDQPPDFTQLFPASTAKLAARAQPSASGNNSLAGPNAGYRRLSNQLYRVEIHQGGTIGTAGTTFKWSRDNGSVVAAWTAKSGNDLTITITNRDDSLGFAIGQWVELTDDTRELLGVSGVLVKIMNVLGPVLTIDPGTATINYTDFPQNPKVRRWDVTSGVVQTTAGTWIPIEDGVEVRFDAGTCAVGDYWVIPARVATRDVEWPKDTNGPLSQDRLGIRHSYGALAIIQSTGSPGTLSLVRDKRIILPALTDLVGLDPNYAKNLVWNHDHSGSTQDKGQPIGRIGIQNNAIDGTKIDPAANVTLNQITVAGALVNGPLKNQGGLVLNDNPIHLRSAAAFSNAIGYQATFAGQAVDGPTAYGFAGGSLGTYQPIFGTTENAAQFDGVNGQISVAMGSPNFTTEGISVETWVRVDAYTPWSTIFDFSSGPSNGNLLLAIRNVNGCYGLCWRSYLAPGAFSAEVRAVNVPIVGKWTHVCVTLDKNGVGVIFVNGVRTASATGMVAPGVLATRTNCLLGKDSWGWVPPNFGDPPLTGALAHVRVWTRILTDTEVATKSSASYAQAANETGLWRYWKLDALTNGKFLNSGGTIDPTGVADGGTPAGNVVVVPAGQQNALVWDRGNNVAVKGNLFLQQQALGNSAGPYGSNFVRFEGVAGSFLQVSGGGLPVIDFNSTGCAFAVEAWVRWEGWLNSSRIIDFGNGQESDNIVLGNDVGNNDLYFAIVKSSTVSFSLTAPGVLRSQVWMHICATVDSTGVATLYVNGTMRATKSGFQLPANIARSLCYFGKSNWAANSPFMGAIAQVRLWNRSLGAGEVSTRSTPGYVPLANETGLARAWKFDALFGGFFVNSAPNGIVNNVTANGTATLENPSAYNVLSWDALGNSNLNGDVGFGDRNLYLRAKPGWADQSHGLGWFGTGKPFSNRGNDGPVLFGWLTGQLGTTNRILSPNNTLEFSGQANCYAQVALGQPAQNWSVTGISIEAWVRWDAFNYWSRVIDFGVGQQSDNIILANFGSTGDLSFNITQGTVNDGGLTVPGALTLGAWTHICAVLSKDGVAELYVNGVRRAYKTGMLVPNNVARPSSFLGKSNWQSSDLPFDGSIAHLRIWTRPLGMGEVLARSSVTWRPGAETGLWRYWPLDSASLQNGVFKNMAPNGDAADATPQGNWALVPSPGRTVLNWDAYGNVDTYGYTRAHILQVQSGSAGMYLTPGWVGFTGPNSCEIANDTGYYKALVIGGNAAADGVRRKIFLCDDVEIGGSLKIDTSGIAGQMLNVNGTANFNGAFTSNAASTINGGLTVNGAVTALNAGLTVSGASTFTGAITATTVTGNGGVASNGNASGFWLQDRANNSVLWGNYSDGQVLMWNLFPGPYMKMWLNTSGTLEVVGAVKGSSKQFSIPHPLKAGHSLVHACIEGPENAVYYRGESQLKKGKATIELPDYFEALTRKESRTVQLTPIFEDDDAPVSLLAAMAPRDGKLRVRGIDSNNPEQRFFWEVKAIRADIAELEIEPLRPADHPMQASPIGMPNAIAPPPASVPEVDIESPEAQ